MKRAETLKFCKTCTKRTFNSKSGIVCSLTNEIASFVNECPDYAVDYREKNEATKKISEEKASLGQQKMTRFIYIIISLSIALKALAYISFRIPLTTTILMDLGKLALQIGLLYTVYSGRNWAKYLLTGAYGIGILFILGSTDLFMLNPMVGIPTILALISLYSYGIYLFNFDKDFRDFFDLQEFKIYRR